MHNESPGAKTSVIAWLMQGDAAIRWQTLRDVLAVPIKEWRAERQQVASSGWGARLLSFQDSGGRWAGGVYSPKWTSSTYTLLQLRDLGLLRPQGAAQRAARLVLDELLGPAGSHRFWEALRCCDLCIVGFLLSISAYFGIADARRQALVVHLLEHQLADGGWNCRRKTQRATPHSSFHTTFNVLEGLHEYAEGRQSAPGAPAHRQLIDQAQRRATEFMLAHKLFRSDTTNQIIRQEFLRFSYPPRWHYDVLRGLDFFQRIEAPRDPRFREAIDLVVQKRRRDGVWPVQNRHPGRTFFEMEKTGGPSRWNTLRALRVLRWWRGGELEPA